LATPVERIVGLCQVAWSDVPPLKGYTNREIDDRLDCTARSVERRLERIRSLCAKYDDASGGLDVLRGVGETHQRTYVGVGRLLVGWV